MPEALVDGGLHRNGLTKQTVTIFGYGNQGRSQALNLRDSGLSVLIANRNDENRQIAIDDGFEVVEFDAGTRRADIIMMLIPDEIQQEIYETHVAGHLSSLKTLCFAHGYNIRFGSIKPPATADVIMVAPRMIGVAVRELFLAARGIPTFIAVEQDASGRAWETTFGLARALGAREAGLIRTTFAEETELDLFSEQVIWPSILRLFSDSFDFLVEAGYSPEAALMELYVSGEPSRVLSKAASVGLFRQSAFHSRTSQFGTLSRLGRIPHDFFRSLARRALAEIRDGSFAEEWRSEKTSGFQNFNRLHQTVSELPINQTENVLQVATGEQSSQS